ncbi:MAG TPA: hypothetical protein VGO60_17030, partial [Iamia sp.]|nr:hypothetical protein [Iamia sp.]
MIATLEDDVRAMLARRAADVPDDDGAAVTLPSGLRIPVDERPPSGRTRWLAAAAALVLLLGAVGLLTRVGGDDAGERTGPAEEPTRPVGPAPPIEGLPQGLTSADLLPVWTDSDTDVEPYPKGDVASSLSNAPLAFGRYLRARLPGMGSSMRASEVDGFPDWYRMEGAIQAPEEGGSADETVAYLWWSGRRWTVMAVLSRIQVFSELTIDGRRIEGSVHGDGDRRAAGLGEPRDDLALDRWQDHLTVVGESIGGDVPIAVS